jgi:hypothetical protein
LGEIDETTEKDGADGVYVVAAEIGPEFEIMPAARQAEVVDELKAPLISLRRRRELPAEYADACQPDARSERVNAVDVVSIAYELESEFIRRSAAENVRLAENYGVVSTTYVEARRGPELSADADAVLTVVGQTASEEKKRRKENPVRSSRSPPGRCLCSKSELREMRRPNC